MTFLGFGDRTWLWVAAAGYSIAFVLGTVAVLRDRRHWRLAMYAIVAVGFLTIKLLERSIPLEASIISLHPM